MIPPLTPIGRIAGKHGFRGELNLVIDRDQARKVIKKGNFLFVEFDGKGVPFCITDVNKSQELIKLKGIDTEEKAKALIGLSFGIPSSKKMSVIPKDNALVGFKITDETSGFQGSITQVETLPQGMMFTVIGTDENNPVLIPLVEAWITRIDEKNQQIYMSLPQGLVDLNKPGTDLFELNLN